MAAVAFIQPAEQHSNWLWRVGFDCATLCFIYNQKTLVSVKLSLMFRVLGTSNCDNDTMENVISFETMHILKPEYTSVPRPRVQTRK